MKYFSTSILTIFVLWPILLAQAAPQQGWHIEQQGTGFLHDTSSGMSERKGILRKNLVSVSRQGENLLESYWEEGAFRATVTYNGKKIVDGFDIGDVSRIKSFRFDKTGSTVYIRTTKGPQAIVELFQDGRPVLSWPRLSLVNILSYRKDKVIVSLYIDKTQRTEFWQYSRKKDGNVEKTGQLIGVLAGCSLLSSKVVKTGIAMAVYCHPDQGSDVKFLEFETSDITDIRATEDDELLAYSWADYDKGTIPVLSISGNSNGRQLFHAVSGSLLSSLGEPMSVSSDESGRQSWSQSYRTRSLAELYRKTGHPVFKDLAIRAMSNVLRQTNGSLGISGEFNPTDGWASRIYSKDGKTPISFMINQAMISSSLITSCRSLGDGCPQELRKSIDQNAQQLVAAYEHWYDIGNQLYRIPYGANFRFDGIWAPWNWQMMWAPVLQHVGQITGKAALVTRAESLANRFVSSWEEKGSKTPFVLWRYWPEPYYEGWTEIDNISISRPKQKPRNMATERYEDINHAGISLLGIFDMSHRLPDKLQQATKQTLQILLNQNSFIARDLDGKGPISPRWLPGAGWHIFDGEGLQDFYARKLPGSVSSDQHLMYALLYNIGESFRLKLSLLQCSDGDCLKSENWLYESAAEFLEYNPLFNLNPIHKLHEVQAKSIP